MGGDRKCRRWNAGGEKRGSGMAATGSVQIPIFGEKCWSGMRAVGNPNTLLFLKDPRS
jgi:hypothetical protein